MRISDLAGCRRKANIVRGEGGGELLDENRSQGREGGGDSCFHDNETSHASENMQARGVLDFFSFGMLDQGGGQVTEAVANRRGEHEP